MVRVRPLQNVHVNKLGTMALLFVLLVSSETIDSEQNLDKNSDLSRSRSTSRRSRSSSRSGFSGISTNVSRSRPQSRSTMGHSHVPVDDSDDDKAKAATCLPCDCYKDSHFGGVVDCSAKNLTRFPSSLPDSTTLNFSSNRLTNDDASLRLCEKYRFFRIVSLAWNGLTSLPKSLKGCQDTLEELSLTGNWLTITELPSDAGSSSPSAGATFHDLQSLRSLDGLWVRNELKSSALTPLTLLSRLDMTYAAPVFPGDLLRPLTRLRVLRLTLPVAQGLPGDLALPAGLEELEVTGGKLKELPSGALRALTKLSSLRLDLPELRRLAWTSADLDASHLEHVSAKGVWEITPESLALMTSLVTLRLEDIRTLTDTTFFDHLTKLKNLEIINCSLGSGTLQWTRKLSGLLSLTLKGTQLTQLPGFTLLGMAALRSLDLSGNHLKRIPNNLLVPVSTTLERLNLSANLLDQFDSSVLPFIPGLSRLDLSRNRLTSLDLNMFANTPRLTQLMLQGNTLNRVGGSDKIRDSSSFHLNLLDLSSNLLETIPASVPLEKISTLDMSYNLLRQGLPFQRLMSLTQPTIIELQTTSIACSCEIYKLVQHAVLIGGVCNSPTSVIGKPTSHENLHALCQVTTPSGNAASIDPITMGLNLEEKDDPTKEDNYWVEGSILRSLGPAVVPSNIRTTSGGGTQQYTTTTMMTQPIKKRQPVGNDGADKTVIERSNPNGKMIASGQPPTNFTTPNGFYLERSGHHKNTQGHDEEHSIGSKSPREHSVSVTLTIVRHANEHLAPTEKTLPRGDESSTIKDIDILVTTPHNADTDVVNTSAAIISGQIYVDASSEGESGRSESPKSSKSTHQSGRHTLGSQETDLVRQGVDKPDTIITTTNAVDDVKSSAPPSDHDPLNVTAIVEDGDLSVGLWDRSDSNATLGSKPATSDDEEDSGLSHLPWVVAVCLLLALLLLGCLVCRRSMRSGSRALAGEMGSDNKAIAGGKMELMELGVAPPGEMPVIM